MFRAFYLFIFSSLLSIALGEHPTIGVPNGGPWGEWGPVEWCPCGYRARGFSLKVEDKMKIEDDTALNGIRLFCVNRNDTWTLPGEIELESKTVYPIQSTEAPWGEWSEVMWCPTGFLVRFSMQVEPHKKGGDDTAANNFMFLCSDYTVHLGSGQSWGHYGKWSGLCKFGICGMKTKVEPPQGTGDDTALNDAQFICCQE
ncbi:vitelline membrane outer layer protein 1-like isoform X1 [Pyxicephalus adspersus]|uniref:vitelline membrane outer layer protein 1-like isoform X1 n=1 Tax=Pyxicephalus adspersus TaxID=30357 RepID=UPI003B58FB8B